jgi:hypothetical protein
MLRIWAYLSTLPRARQCAAAVLGGFVVLVSFWIAYYGQGVPMEWPQ